MQLLSMLLILSNLYLVWSCSRMVCISQMITVCGDKWGRYFYTTGCCFLLPNRQCQHWKNNHIWPSEPFRLSDKCSWISVSSVNVFAFYFANVRNVGRLSSVPAMSVAVLALRSGRISQLADICNFWWWKPSDDDMDFLSLGRNCQIPLAICRSCRHLTPTRTAFTALLARSVWFCSGSRNCASAALLY